MAIKQNFQVLYRSIFDVVRDFLRDEALEGEERVLTRYLKPDLLIIDDMGMKELPRRSGETLFEIIMRRYETALDGDDEQPTVGGLGQTDWRRAECDGDSGPLPAPCDDHQHGGPELPSADASHSDGRGRRGIKTRKPADRLGGQEEAQIGPGQVCRMTTGLADCHELNDYWTLFNPHNRAG